MASQRPSSLHSSTSFSPSVCALRWIGTFAVLAFLASLFTVSSCALGRSYCLADTDCKPGYLCLIAQCTLASSDASPNDTPPQESDPNDTPLQESDPSDTPLQESDPNDTPPESDPNDTPIPDGVLCVDGATRLCDLSNDPNCIPTARNHYNCQNTCYKGIQRCAGGMWPALCETSNLIGAETCDGIDNDCDGQIDEALKPCLTTLLRLTNPGNSLAVGLAIDPKTQALYTAVRNTNQTRFFLKKITLSTLQEAPLAVVSNPSTLPRNYEDVTALALHTTSSPTQLTLYFTEKKGCILYKAALTGSIARVERLGDGECRAPVATLYTSPLPIQNARFIDIISLSVHQPTGKLYIAEQTDKILHVFDPTTNTLQTLHTAEKDGFLCKKSPSLSLLSLATETTAESVFLLHQFLAAEAGIFSFDFAAATCTNAPLRVIPSSGLITPTTFAPVFEENKSITAFYFSQRDNTAAAQCSLFRGVPAKTQINAPVSVIANGCSLQDGSTTQGATPAPQVGHLPAMTWDPSQKRLYFLDQSPNGSTHLRRLTP